MKSGPGIKSKRAVSCRHEPTPGAQIFLFLLHFLITKTLVSSCVSGEVTGFVSDFLSSCRTDSRFPVSDERFSLTACGSTYAGHITYAGRWFLPPPLSLLGPSSPLCTFPPDSRSPVHSISGLPSSGCIASERRLDPKKLGAPSTKTCECSCLLPTPKISRDSSNHPVRHSSIMRAVVLPPVANHL